MNKKGSVLMITLWILAILVIFALGLGQRASLSLKQARYQRDRLKATYLAKAGINRTIVEIKKDDPSYDYLKDKWADNKEIFEKIILGKDIKDIENIEEYATVSYLVKDKDTGKEETIYGVIDEERKININTASKELLVSLLTEKATAEIGQDADTIADLIRAWRGEEIPGLSVDITGFKKSVFSVPEELLLILEYFYEKKGDEDYQKKSQEVFDGIKDLITVWGNGDGRVNINTAPEDILKILINTSYDKLLKRDIEVKDPEGLLESVLTYKENGAFTDIDLDTKLTGLINPQKNIITDPIDGLKNKICVQSNYFRIESTGYIGKIKNKVTAIVKRGTPIEIVYWHEN